MVGYPNGKELVLKTSDAIKGTRGSNPLPIAKIKQ